MEVVIETKRLEDRRKSKMELREALPKEIEDVRNLLTPKGLWHTFDGDDYDVWAIKVSNLLKLQDMWHFIVEEDHRDQD